MLVGRAGGIRTRGLFVPNEALYQAEPQPEVLQPGCTAIGDETLSRRSLLWQGEIAGRVLEVFQNSPLKRVLCDRRLAAVIGG